MRHFMLFILHWGLVLLYHLITNTKVNIFLTRYGAATILREMTQSIRGRLEFKVGHSSKLLFWRLSFPTAIHKIPPEAFQWGIISFALICSQPVSKVPF